MAQTLSAWLDEKAFETPNSDFITIKEEGLVYSYAKFNERVNCLAKGLLYVGVKRNTVVGIWLAAKCEILHYTFALAKIGAIAVPINASTQLEELKRILSIGNLGALVISNRSMENGYMDILFDLIPSISFNERGYLHCVDFPALNTIVCSGHLKNQGFYNTHELMLLGSHCDDLELEFVQEEVTPNDTLFASFTINNNQLSIKKTSHAQLVKKGVSEEFILSYF